MPFDHPLYSLGETEKNLQIERLRDTIYDVLIEDAKAHKELPLTRDRIEEFLSTPIPDLLKNVVQRAQAEVETETNVKKQSESAGKKLMYASAFTVGKRLGLTPKSLTEADYNKRSDEYKDRLLKKIFNHNLNK